MILNSNILFQYHSWIQRVWLTSDSMSSAMK
jgi:hypothetical protein